MGNVLELSTERRMILDVDFKPLTEIILEPLEYKVDTGADFTTISRVDLLALGYDEAWIKSNGRLLESGTTTADGSKASSYVIKFPLFNLQGLDFRNWPLYVIFDSVCECGKVTHRDYRNLVGSDVLDMFDLIRYTKKCAFELVPAPPFMVSQKVFSDQTVDAVTYRYHDQRY